MKIAIISNRNKKFRNTNLYRENAIKELGHEILFVNDRKFLIPGRIRRRYSILQKCDTARLNLVVSKKLLREKPDLCMFVGGFRTSAKTLLKLKNSGIRNCLWTSDAPIRFDNILKTVSYYDHVFCAGSEAVEMLESHCRKQPILMPFGCDPDFHASKTKNRILGRRNQRDIVFVGSFYPNRWKALKRLKNENIGIWGPNWNEIGKDQNGIVYVEDTYLDVDEWVEIYSSAKIILVIHFQDGETPCFQASPKVYEALSCKGFVLVDNQKDVFKFFKNRKHLVRFDDDEDLVTKVKYYLNKPEERRKIAVAGYNEVRAKHTYKHRIEKMLSTIL
jgi:spore maturation protein CgeB